MTLDAHRKTHRGEGDVKTEAEAGVMQARKW